MADVRGKGRHLPCCACGSAGKHPAHHDNTIRSLPWRIIHIEAHTSLIWILDVSIRTRLQFSKCGTLRAYENAWIGYIPEAIEASIDMPGQKHHTIIFALISTIDIYKATKRGLLVCWVPFITKTCTDIKTRIDRSPVIRGFNRRYL